MPQARFSGVQADSDDPAEFLADWSSPAFE